MDLIWQHKWDWSVLLTTSQTHLQSLRVSALCPGSQNRPVNHLKWIRVISSRWSNARRTLWEVKGSWRSTWDLFQSGLNFYHSALLWNILQSPLCKADICTLNKMLVEKNIVFEKCRSPEKSSENRTFQDNKFSCPRSVLQKSKLSRVCQRSGQGVSYLQHKMSIYNFQSLSSLLKAVSE